MISFSGLLGDITSYGDRLRYRRQVPKAERRPIVVWNCTRRCNLSCVHCYADSHDVKYEGELSTQEARAMIDSLKAFGAPVLLFSGGEPLLREDLFELNAYARSCGLRTVISTNGTLITSEMAERIHEAGFEYIGVSLDGIGKNNDRFRGKIGAFDAALSGVRNLVAVGQKVGLRFTITRHNYKEIPRLFELVETEGVARICFYHLAYAGRGADLQKEDLSHADTRAVVEGIMRWSRSLIDRGIHKEVLTVDNHADGALLYLHLLKDDPARAKEVYGLLRANGGNASGISIANVDNLGYVHPDQFWHDVTFGNVRERSFGDIWMDKSHPMMGKLKDRTRYLKGRCARCRFLDICDGNLRLRAEVIGDVWGDDPACYLTDDEIYRTEVPGV